MHTSGPNEGPDSGPPTGPTCPHCGADDPHHRTNLDPDDRGFDVALYQCRRCGRLWKDAKPTEPDDEPTDGPTGHNPGTLEKVRVMRRRIKLGQRVCHRGEYVPTPAGCRGMVALAEVLRRERQEEARRRFRAANGKGGAA